MNLSVSFFFLIFERLSNIQFLWHDYKFLDHDQSESLLDIPFGLVCMYADLQEGKE